MKISLFHLCSALFLTTFASGAVAITYSNNNAPGFELKDQNAVPLSIGVSGNHRDGAVFEVGYYSLATTTNPFAGDWIPMVSPYVPSNYNTIGDGDANNGPGLFDWANPINSETSALGGYDLPAAGTLLSIRFYNNRAYATPTYFNSVSSLEWVFPGADPDSPLDMDLTTDVLLWQGGESSAFRTTMPVPEASSGLLALVAGSAFLTRRKRRN